MTIYLYIHVRPSVAVRCQSIVNTFDQATSTSPWDFNVNIGIIWTCKWPRPKHSDVDTLCNFSVDDVKLEVESLVALAAKRPGGTASVWIDILQPHLQEAEGVPFINLVDFLTIFPTNKLLKPLYAQVVWNIGAALEQTLGRILQEKEEPNDYIKGAVYENATYLSGRELDEYCTKYVYGGIEHLKHYKQFTLATDKGSVCKLPLQDTAISTPKTNDVVLCTPHVNIVFPGRRFSKWILQV